MSDEFNCDIFTKGSVADIPVMIQKAHTSLYEQQQNFKYKISSECQVISTCTKTMIDLCSRMKRCVESLSNIKDDMIKFSDYKLSLESSAEDCVDVDVMYDIRWIQNLSFRSYKLIKDKIFAECFKLMFIEAVQKFKDLESNSGDNLELLRELECNKNIYFKILVPNLYKEVVAQLDNKSYLNDLITSLIIIIAMELYTGGDIKYVKNLYINYRSTLIENLTDVNDLLTAMQISYIALEVFSLKLFGGKLVEHFKKFSSSSNIVLSEIKYISTSPNWLDVVSQKLCDILSNSSNFVHVELITKIISTIENENYDKLPHIIQNCITDLGLETPKIQIDFNGIVSAKLKSVKDILSSYIPKIITKWLGQTFDYNSGIENRITDFFVTLDKLTDLLDNNSLDKFKGELSKNIKKINKLIDEDLKKLGEITFDNASQIVKMPCICNLKFLDILASRYIFDKNDYCGKYFGTELINLVKSFAEAVNNLIKINVNKNVNIKGPRMTILSELLIRSRFIHLYIYDERQLIVNNIIAYKTFKPLKINDIQDAIDSEFMLLKYREYTSNKLTKEILNKLGLDDIKFTTVHKYEESRQIAADVNTNTRYMFPGLTHPITNTS